MTDLLNAAQMRGWEEAAIAAGAATGRDLMERAGRGVVNAIFETWPELAAASGQAMIFCGPGNNGGDGFVIARLLKAWGWEVTACLLGDPDRLPPDARANCLRWQEMGALLSLECGIEPGDDVLLVDALFGTGLGRPLEGPARAACDLRAGKVVSVDMPSGICSDSGRVIGGAAFRADLTVSFHAEKCGHHLAEGPEHCGRLVCVDIGLPGGASGVSRVVAPDPARLAKTIGHKYSHGHALILTGGAGRTGAARLAARAALRIGAGAVTLGAPGSALLEVACQITAPMLRRVDDGAGLAAVLGDGRINALCLGPGLGVARARSLVAVACGGVARCPVVLDADALTAFEAAPEALFAMLHDRCVLTPHAGEFARLFPDLAARLRMPAASGPAFSKIDATRAAAARAGCVVLFKGPDTVIAAPDGHAMLHSAHYGRAAPWLATAGAGDVLAGMIAGLMARGMAPVDAAETAVWLHAEAALRFGPGLIAEDLPEALPGVLRAL